MNWSASVARAVLPSQLSGRFVKLEQTHSFSVHMISWQPVQVRDGWSASVYLQSHVIPHFRSCPLSKVENVKLVQWIGSASQLGVQCRCNRHNSKLAGLLVSPSEGLYPKVFAGMKWSVWTKYDGTRVNHQDLCLIVSILQIVPIL